MKVFFLGTGGMVSASRRAQPSVLLWGSEPVLLDAGCCVERRLIALGIDVCMINRIYVSHSHLDHIGGLAALLNERAKAHCRGPVAVYAPRDERLETFVNYFSPRSVPRPELFLYDPPCRVPSPEGWVVRAIKALHPVPSASYIIEAEGRRIVYSGDTSPNPELAEGCRDADLAIYEATMPLWMESEAAGFGHSTWKDALEICGEAKILALIHLSLESERELVSGNTGSKGIVLVPSDLTVLEV